MKENKHHEKIIKLPSGLIDKIINQFIAQIYLKVKKKMKKSQMKSPVITQLYNQKLIHTAHVKRLSDIKQFTKPLNTIDTKRSSLIESIRKNKAHTFALNFTLNTQDIEHKNTTIVKRLSSVKPSPSCQQRNNKTMDEYRMNLSNRSRMSMKDMQREKQVEKENQRLYVKLRTASSSLRPENFIEDFQKTQRIKQRIMQYSCDANNPSKVGLKSQRYMTLKGSYHYSKTSTLRSDRSSINKSLQLKQPKRNTAHHYNRADIKNNTIEKINQRYSTLLGKMEQKSVIIGKSKENQEDSTFLTTQSQGGENDGINRLTFGRNNKVSTNLREGLKQKRYFLDENNNKAKSLLNPIQKLQKIKNTQKLNEN